MLLMFDESVVRARERYQTLLAEVVEERRIRQAHTGWLRPTAQSGTAHAQSAACAPPPGRVGQTDAYHQYRIDAWQ
ncbi:MAG: hypothetical protein ACUVSW_13540 [Roseiflexus sp.]